MLDTENELEEDWPSRKGKEFPGENSCIICIPIKECRITEQSNKLQDVQHTERFGEQLLVENYKI